MVEVPEETVDTRPVDALIVALLVVLLVHVPPLGVADNREVLPIQIARSPVIAEGAVLTVTITVR
jgi:hypothetical protein